MATNNPPAKAGERESFETLYRRAAEGLTKLFGSEKEKGIFQQEPLPAGFASRTQFVRSIMDASGNKVFFDTLPQPFTNTLATVIAARGNSSFNPDLVVEFTFRSSDEEEDEEATKENRVENIRALAEIHHTTDGRVSLRLPFNGKLDFQGMVVGMFLALTEDEKAALQLGGERKHSSDLLEALGEVQPRTPVQRLSARATRWAERREAGRAERERRVATPAEDAAAALPRVAQVTKLAPTPAVPVIPDLSILTGGAAQPPAVLLRALPRLKKAPPAIVPPAAPPPAKEPKPAPTTRAAEEDPAVVAALLDEGSPKAKAMALFLRRGKKSLAEAVALAKAEDLL